MAKNQLPSQVAEWITVPGIAKNPGLSTALHTLEWSHKGHHEKSYQEIDRLSPSKRLIREQTENKRTGSQHMKSGHYLHHGMPTLGPVVVPQQVVDPGHLLPPP